MAEYIKREAAMDVRKKLVEMLAEYFNIGDSYAYNLTRVKSAFACGTVGLDDFEEFDDETVEDIASYLIDNSVTVQEWISVDDMLPEDDSDVLAYSRIGEESRIYPACYSNGVWFDCVFNAPATDTTTHWMPMPQPPKGE